MDQKHLLIFVNGYTHGCEPLRPYWTERGTQFLDAAQNYLGSGDLHFVNGEAAWYSSAGKRFRNGEKYAAAYIGSFEKFDEISLVAHSMGGAFAEGMAAFLTRKGIKVRKIVHFSTADAHRIVIPKVSRSISRIQLELCGDRTLKRKNMLRCKPQLYISGVNHYGRVHTDVLKMHPKASPKDQKKWDFHYDTKTFSFAWDYLKTLETLQLQQLTNGSFQTDLETPLFLELLWQNKLVKRNKDATYH